MNRRGLAMFGAGLFGLAFAVGGLLTPTSANDLPIGTTREVEDPDPAPPRVIEPAEEDGPQFFSEELPSEGDSVIYVVDRSSSMSLPVDPYVGLDGNIVSNGTRLDYVKAELKRSINSLSESFTFNIVVYDECVERWRPSRQQSTLQRKAEAMSWIDGIQPWGWTNTGGATSLALSDSGNKTVLLLSDGAPNFLDCAQSYVGDFQTHKNIIHQANQQDAVIHTFGIGLDPETRTFLLQIAQENGGTFREVQ